MGKEIEIEIYNPWESLCGVSQPKGGSKVIEALKEYKIAQKELDSSVGTLKENELREKVLDKQLEVAVQSEINDIEDRLQVKLPGKN